MLLAGARIDIVQSLVADLSPGGVSEIKAIRNALEKEALAAARRELGGPPDAIRWQADMRYRGQRHSLTVEFVGDPSAETLAAAFETAYGQRFGRTLSEDFSPEIIGLRAIAEGAKSRLALSALAPKAGGGDPSPREKRRLHVRTLGWVEADVWDRAVLPSGFRVRGPAIVEEYSATTLVGPDDVATVGPLGEIVISIV